jgi:hypothetical protein
VSLRTRIERLERELFPGSKTTITLSELQFVVRMQTRYGEDFESVPAVLRSEYNRLAGIFPSCLHRKGLTPPKE